MSFPLKGAFKPNVHHDLESWWVKSSKCQPKGSFPWSKDESFTRKLISGLKNVFETSRKVS